MRGLLVSLVFLSIAQCSIVNSQENAPQIAILQESFSPQPLYADPEEIKTFLQSLNIQSQSIGAAQLADPDFLDPNHIDIVFLPYGACFPNEAKKTFVRYLKQGGSFISVGGYAFDDLMLSKDGKWEKFETDDQTEYLSGRRGRPGDAVSFQPDQIIVFDPTYQFKRAVSIGKSSDSPLDGPDWSRSLTVEGFPATAMTGNNTPVFPNAYAQWYPLVTAHDRYGRDRGSVFSLMIHHDGPFKGSAWAFSGVTNVNLFSKQYPEMLRTLTETIEKIRLRKITPFSYEYTKSELSPSETPQTRFTFTDNYFHIDGVPKILFGTNQTGMVWYSPRENPATWERDFQRMRDYGLRVLRVLHFSPFAAQGYEGRAGHLSLDLAKSPPQKMIEQTDDLVALCGKYGVALFLTLHDWLPVELTDEELAAQETWALFWAGRYQDRPYVFFDIQNEPSIQPADLPHVKQLWNDYLKEHYKTNDNLKQQWGEYAPQESIGDIPCDAGAQDWQNPRAADFHRFRAWLCQRWIDANVGGIKSVNPNALATVGFLQSEWQADKLLPTSKLDFSNTHYHGPVERFPPIFKFTDRRFRGQGLSVGEFGGWDAHEARTHGRFIDETPASIRHFLAIGHDMLGMGGSMALNWDLKDMDDCVFPWGLTYAQDAVPKDWTNAYRNMSFFFSALEPKYESPNVFLLIPDGHRMGSNYSQVHDAVHNTLEMLFARHLNFGVINEDALGELPVSANVLVWPIPYCPSDDAFNSVCEFVEKGGHLYFSGDIGFDALRRPSKKERFARLNLELREPRIPFSLNSVQEKPVFETSSVGNGTVHFFPLPVEMDNEKALAWNPYPEFLEAVGAETIQVEPNDPNLHLFSIPETNGNRVYTLFRNEKVNGVRSYRIQTSAGEIAMGIDGMETGSIEVDQDGNTIAVEGNGDIVFGNRLYAKTSSLVMIRSLGGEPLLDSHHIVIYPIHPGELELSVPAMDQPALVVGEYAGGIWTTYEELSLEKEANAVQFKIDPDRANAILLLVDQEYDQNELKQLLYE